MFSALTPILSLAVCALLGTQSEGLAQAQKPVDSDIGQAQEALQAYLELRKNYDQDYAKRYDMLSEGAQQFLRSTYGVGDAGELEKFEGDLARFGDFKILSIKKVRKDKTLAKAHIQVLTEHPDGAVARDELFTCMLIRVRGRWKIDHLLKRDGTPYWP